MRPTCPQTRHTQTGPPGDLPLEAFARTIVLALAVQRRAGAAGNDYLLPALRFRQENPGRVMNW